MKLRAVLNKTDRDMVELYHYHNEREFLAGAMHIDCFSGPVNERIIEGHPVMLHLEIAEGV